MLGAVQGVPGGGSCHLEENGTELSEITGELARVAAAFEQPALSLLHRKYAAAVVTIFRTCFARDVRTVASARLHAQVEALLTEMSASGTREALPAGNGRELCMRWVRDQWLVRSSEADGGEVYSLTSHAQQSMKFVQDLRRERSNLSEHRITNIVSTARRINSDTNPDRGARIAILDADIARLTAERDRLEAGGEMLLVSAEYLVEGFIELLSLVSQLPSDFARVEEAYTTLRGQILADFRAEQRTPGEVIDYYLQRTDALMGATPEGRAFEGAFALLRDEALLLQLREDLNAMLEHPTSQQILVDQDRQELRGIVALIRSGLSSVLAQRNRVSTTLRDYIMTRDVVGDREVDRVLRGLEAAVSDWMPLAGPRENVPVRLLPETVDIEHLRERFHDPADDVAPPPLVEIDETDRPPAPSLAELRRYGGPFLDELRDALDAAVGATDDWTMGGVFEDLPPKVRRPVDALGLLHLSTNRDALSRTGDTEQYVTLRPDGSTRTFDIPVVAPVGNQTEEAS